MIRTRFWVAITDSTRTRRGLLVALAALGLASCATEQPAKPELGINGQPIIQAGDVAIAGQLAAHAIIELPEIAGDQTPPLVRFAGVTSIVTGPVDTTPYTVLLRDRLLLLTREKLRFVERQLPALGPHKVKHSKDVAAPIDVDTDADYQIQARLQGNFGDDDYLLEVQFLDLHSNQPLFDQEYRIRKEEQNAANGATTISDQPVEPTNPTPPPIEDTAPMPPQGAPPPSPDNSGLQ